MRVYAPQLFVESDKALSTEASQLGLPVGHFPETIEYGTRTYAAPVRVLNKFRDLEAYRYTALDNSTLTIWND
jgi:hypothetical protein